MYGASFCSDERAADPEPLRPGHLLHLGCDDHAAGPGTAVILLVAVGGAFGGGRRHFGTDSRAHDCLQIEIGADGDWDADFVRVFFADEASCPASLASGRAIQGG